MEMIQCIRRGPDWNALSIAQKARRPGHFLASRLTHDVHCSSSALPGKFENYLCAVPDLLTNVNDLDRDDRYHPGQAYKCFIVWLAWNVEQT